MRAVAAGGQHTVAVTETSVYSWGSNSSGQLGTRTFRDKATPTQVLDLEGKGVVQLACGTEHTLFLCRSDPYASSLPDLLYRRPLRVSDTKPYSRLYFVSCGLAQRKSLQ